MPEGYEIDRNVKSHENHFSLSMCSSIYILYYAYKNSKQLVNNAMLSYTILVFYPI